MNDVSAAFSVSPVKAVPLTFLLIKVSSSVFTFSFSLRSAMFRKITKYYQVAVGVVLANIQQEQLLAFLLSFCKVHMHLSRCHYK